MDTRFATAIHLLVLVSSPQGRGLSAERIAHSVGTHPVRVRQILARLARAGLSKTIRGRAGGTFLGRPAESISLGDIYAAVYDDPRLLPQHPAPDPRCLVGRNLPLALLTPFAMAEAAMVESLRQTNIADLARRVTEGYRRPR